MFHALWIFGAVANATNLDPLRHAPYYWAAWVVVWGGLGLYSASLFIRLRDANRK